MPKETRARVVSLEVFPKPGTKTLGLNPGGLIVREVGGSWSEGHAPLLPVFLNHRRNHYEI